MSPKYEILFTATKIGSVEPKNRFIMCAMASTKPFLEQKQKPVHILGDADRVANLKAAIWAANDLAIKLSE